MLLDITDPLDSKKEEVKPNPILGIDFGTTNSIIAYCEGENTRAIKISDNELLPSIVRLGQIEISSIKRLFGKSYNEIMIGDFISDDIKNALSEEDGQLYIKDGDRKIHITQIASKIFQNLKSEAEKELGIACDKVVVTVPAYFDEPSKKMVKDSAKLAGLDVVRLLAEPTSAAYYYGLDNKAEGNYIVYDLGGGTFDVSVLTMKMGAFKVVSIGGDELLGGDDIDFAIARFLREKFSLKLINDSEINKYAKELKHKLSNADYAAAEIVGEIISLTENELEEIAKPYIDKTFSILKKTIYESKIKDFSGIILVGGSTRLKYVQLLFRKNFPDIEILGDVDPDKIVAFGAAKQGYNLANKSGDLLIDVAPLSLGIELMGGVVERIIQRNTPLPCKVTRKYTTYADNQTSLDFHIVQGDRELAVDCRSLAKFKLSKIPPMIAGKAIVEVEFALDNDGLLTVSATERLTNKSQIIEVKPSYGLSDEKIYDMIKSAFENAEEDLEKSKFISKKIDLESSVTRLLSLITSNKDLIGEEKFEIIRAKCKSLTENINLYNYEELESELENLEKISLEFIEELLSRELNTYLKGKDVDQFK